jgi:hypothetical protein
MLRISADFVFGDDICGAVCHEITAFEPHDEQKWSMAI